MVEPNVNRKLAAILSADVVGYSRLMHDDEPATVALLKDYRAAVGRVIERRKGRVVNAPGDSILAEFPSAVEAVQAAVEIQQSVQGRNVELPEDRRMAFRIGVNLGDVIEEDDGTIYGDGVNIAARMEALADAGGICIASTVYDAVEGKLDCGFDFLGERQVKNIAKPINVYRVRGEASATPPHPKNPKRRRALIGALGAGAAFLIVAAGAWWWIAREPAPHPLTTAATLPAGPSIAVLPFTNLSGGHDNERFSDGLTESIISGFSKFDSFMIVARNSTFQYKGKSVDVREVGAALNVRYVLEGSVQRSGDRLRVSAQALDAGNGDHLWSETYDRDVTAATILDFQDDITAHVVSSLASYEAPLWQAEIRKMGATNARDQDSYGCILLSHVFFNNFTGDDHERARNCLEQAVQRTPTYAPAWIELAWIYITEYRYQFNLRPEPLERALAAAQHALELNPQNYFVSYGLAMIHFNREQELDSFYALAEKALDLNPFDATMIAEFGAFMAYTGDWDRGAALGRKAIALAPAGWMYTTLALDHYRKGEYRQALIEGQKINLPESNFANALLAAIYGKLGDKEKASVHLKRVLAVQPGFAAAPGSLFLTRRMTEDLVDSLMDGLRKAGLDELRPAN